MLKTTSRTRSYLGAIALSGSVALSAGCTPAVTTEQEVQMGGEYAAQLAQELPLIRDAQVVQYINQLGRSIAQRADPRGIQYTFYVVNAPEVNAFAVPGGYIYVNRGLIERTVNMSELAGVLAHEIGHVVHRHSIDQIQRAQTANTGLGVLYGVLLGRNPSGIEQVAVQGVGSAVFAGYSRDAERESDASAIQYLINSGINPSGMATMFEKLMAEQQRNPGAVERWFSTHPTSQERVDNTRAAVAALPAGTLRGLSTTTQTYTSFRNRVRGLPAAASR